MIDDLVRAALDEQRDVVASLRSRAAPVLATRNFGFNVNADRLYVTAYADRASA